MLEVWIVRAEREVEGGRGEYEEPPTHTKLREEGDATPRRHNKQDTARDTFARCTRLRANL